MTKQDIKLNQEGRDRYKYLGNDRVYPLRYIQAFASKNNLEVNISKKHLYTNITLTIFMGKRLKYIALDFNDSKNTGYFILDGVSITHPSKELLTLCNNFLQELDIQEDETH